MKIIKKPTSEIEAITFRLPKSLSEKLTKLAKESNISKQKLVVSILEQVVEDKKFKLEIKED